jgi:hypothetical protein
MIIPQARYFLNRIRGLFRSRSKFQRSTKLTGTTTADLHLWHDFLHQARKMVSMNLLTTQRPTHILFLDACPGGLAGYSITTGEAWCFQIDPSQTHPKVSNKLLEFIGAMVQIWLTSGFNPTCNCHSCLLAWTNSSSGAGWLHKSSFDEHDELRRRRPLSPLRSLHPTTRISHPLPLSRTVPRNFRIALLPNEISSWIS